MPITPSNDETLDPDPDVAQSPDVREDRFTWKDGDIEFLDSQGLPAVPK